MLTLIILSLNHLFLIFHFTYLWSLMSLISGLYSLISGYYITYFWSMSSVSRQIPPVCHQWAGLSFSARCSCIYEPHSLSRPSHQNAGILPLSWEPRKDLDRSPVKIRQDEKCRLKYKVTKVKYSTAEELESFKWTKNILPAKTKLNLS